MIINFVEIRLGRTFESTRGSGIRKLCGPRVMPTYTVDSRYPDFDYLE